MYKPLSRQRRRSSSRSRREDRQKGCYKQRGGDNGTVLTTAVTQEQEQVSKLLRLTQPQYLNENKI